MLNYTVVRSNILQINFNKTSVFRGMLGGALFGAIFIGGLIMLIPHDSRLIYFWSASMVAVFILMLSISINKQSSKNIEDILERVKRIEERLDGLHKK